MGEEKLNFGGVLLWVLFGQREEKEEEKLCLGFLMKGGWQIRFSKGGLKSGNFEFNHT